MYNKVYDFCKVRNEGNVYKNGDEPTPRLKFLMSLLDSEGIEYKLDTYTSREIKCYNIVMRGTSNRMVVAHHDIVNPNIDNANDNSASVINAIMIKKLMPDMNVVILDGEEVGGLGSQRCSELINDGFFGEIEWVLNLELTGKGGKYFFIGDYPGKLTDHIKSLFDCPIVRTPFNDSVTFRRNGIDSCVINPLPPTENGEESIVKWDENTFLNFRLLFNCHNEKDTVDTISADEMREFVEEVVIPILKN
jgi:hypothetical protein